MQCKIVRNFCEQYQQRAKKKSSNAKHTEFVDGVGETAEGGVSDLAEAASRGIMAGIDRRARAERGGRREGEGDGSEESEEDGEGLHIDYVAEWR